MTLVAESPVLDSDHFRAVMAEFSHGPHRRHRPRATRPDRLHRQRRHVPVATATERRRVARDRRPDRTRRSAAGTTAAPAAHHGDFRHEFTPLIVPVAGGTRRPGAGQGLRHTRFGVSTTPTTDNYRT